MPKKLVLAFSGAIGSGRSELSRLVAEKLHWPLLRFGDYLRGRVGDEAAQERAALQRLGQMLVVSDTFGFVEAFLTTSNWQESGYLVIDGLRHAEILVALREKVKPAVLKVIHVVIDDDTRQDRALRSGIEGRRLSRFDQDITEAQIPRILPGYADLVVDGTLPYPDLVETIVRRLVTEAAPPAQVAE